MSPNKTTHFMRKQEKHCQLAECFDSVPMFVFTQIEFPFS